ncbi:MAG: LuxR C-terminal-related transcriptional regulator [Nocardioidaceae bacterium]
MTVALVETKFFLPYVRDGLVPRARLGAALNSRRARLTLLSAPAGFGKTTLLAMWLGEAAAATSRARRLAWVSLDESDREPETFWTYLLTALERAVPGTGSAGLALFGAGQPIEVVLAAVLNELSVLPEDVALVLDDYHLAESPRIQPGMALLVERLPPQVRLVISTRADPSLPLARLRARGDLTEVRAADLRFTHVETTEFLADATGLALDAADVAALGTRTEGWIASLQLAALSLRDRDDPSGFIAGFAGTDRYVVDYLVEEVLDDEPGEVRDFLLNTAILDRLSGSLCDAINETTGGAQMLEALERRNLFVVPLDDQRRWYRYHHLFADVLHAHLLQERPDAIPGLHRRASRWYAGAGEPEDAVRHALAAGDVDTAADLVEAAILDLRRERRESTIRRWANDFPDDVVRERPVLAVGFIGALMASNEFGEVEARLRAAEQTLARPASELVVVDRDELARLPAAVETYWAGLALIAGDLAGTLAHAQQAMAVAVEGDDLTRSAAAALAGLACWASGDITAAHDAYATSRVGLTRAGHIADVLGCSLALADMELALGRLGDAERTLEHALELAERRDPGRPMVMRGTADMVVGLSRVAWHRNDLAAAAEFLRRADDLGESAGLPQHPYRWRVALARLRAAEGNVTAAVELLDEAERVYVGDFSPQIHPIHATRARMLVASGDLAGAAAWAHHHEIGADDDLSYLREYEHLTLARLLLAQHTDTECHGALETANTLLDRLLAAAVTGHRVGTTIEIEILRALTRSAAGDRDAALGALVHAVDLAEPDEWVRVFVDAGPAAVPLLHTLAERRPTSDYLRALLGAATSSDQPIGEPVGDVEGVVKTPASEVRQPLVDPLSDRELDVLRLLGSDLDGPAIARELVVSLNTVRTHTKHIYAKLGVNSRRSAVSKAHQLGLLSRSVPR